MSNFTPSLDLSVADGRETVHLLRRYSQPIGEDLLVAGVLRCPIIRQQREPADGRMSSFDVVWRTPLAGSRPPVPGDAILDASGTSWTILEVDELPLAMGWRLVARDATIFCGLVTFFGAHYEKSPGGALLTSWQECGQVMACIEPVEAAVTNDGTGEATTRRARVYLYDLPPSMPSPDHTFRIRDAQLRSYRIQSVAEPKRVGEPMTLEVELVP